MLNRFIYVLFWGLLVIEIMLYPKKEKRTMLLLELSVSIITVLCYGLMIAQVYTVLRIPVNIQSMNISYVITSIFLGFIIIQRKKIQKLYFDKWQAFCVFLFSVVFLFFELKSFSYELRASFVNTHDAGVHFEMAMNVVRNEAVGRMPFAPFHNAMVIELLSPWLPESKYYKAFIVADSLHYYFELIFFYSLTLEFSKKKVSKYIAPMITLLYWLGYPLYSYAVGNFVYWGWGVILCAYVVYSVRQVLLDDKKKVYYIGIILGIIGVVQCYMLFVPMLLVGLLFLIFPYIYKIAIENKKIIIIVGICMLAVVAVLGCALYVYFGKSSIGLFTALQTDGWIYSNLGSDFLLTLPIIIAYIYYAKEKKQYSSYLIFLLSNVVYVLLMLFLVVIKFMSVYYCCKYYYALWFFWWIVVLKAIDEMEIKQEAIQYVKVYLWFLAIAYTGCFGRIDRIAPTYNRGNLYSYTLSYLDENYEKYKYSSGSIELNGFVKEILVDNGYRVVMINYNDSINDINDAIWYRAMTGQNSTDYRIECYQDAEWKTLIEQSEAYDYFVITKKSLLYQDNIELFNQYIKVFENEEGIVIQNS